MTQDTQALKAAGYLERREFTSEVAKYVRGKDLSMVQLLVGRRLPKVFLRFIEMELAVLPSDRSWQGLYSPECAPLMAAFINWNDFDKRRSNYEIAGFFHELSLGTGWYQRQTKRMQRLLAPFVRSTPVLRIVKSA